MGKIMVNLESKRLGFIEKIHIMSGRSTPIIFICNTGWEHQPDSGWGQNIPQYQDFHH